MGIPILATHDDHGRIDESVEGVTKARSQFCTDVSDPLVSI
jgi:hypothetical protein